MNDYFKQTFGLISNIINYILIFIVFILVFILISAEYQSNAFAIKINDNNLSVYYEEKYKNTLLFLSGKSNYVTENNAVSRISLSNKYLLTIDEYELYSPNGRVINADNWNISTDNKKKILDSDIKIKIETVDGIIYDGNYEPDITNYITKPGRYYFHIYVNSSRNPKFLSSVKTHISFNIMIGDNNEKN
ncbi:MAG: hypothetical protein IJ572_04905 [Bacilli bacterium]|nr:hypothetical protein [Bacilli bacterium]